MLRVRVPASTANLGPGLDILGMALELHNEVLISPGAEFKVTMEGEGAREIPLDETNLVYKAMAAVMALRGQGFPKVAIHLINRIPLARGMGSSAAAIIGGMLAANALLQRPLGMDELLDLASDMEGHPDNVAAALWGGITVAGKVAGQTLCKRITPPRDLTTVVAVPDFWLATEISRQVLPSAVPVEDAVFNLGRLGLLLISLIEGDLDLMGQVMEDKLHQPYRLPLVPGMKEVFEAARRAGALSVALSGSGPTLIAFARGNCDAIRTAMEKTFQDQGVSCTSWELRPSSGGAEVITGAEVIPKLEDSSTEIWG